MKKNLLKRNTWLIVSLALLLAALTAAAVMLTRDKSNSVSAPTVAEKIRLAEFSVSDVRKIEYTIGGAVIKLTKNESQWILDSYPERETDGELISGMLTALTSLGATRSVEGGNLADFGLDEPTLSVYVKLKDGAEHSYKVGVKNSFNGYSYISADGKVYLFSDRLSSCFDKDVKDILGLDDRFPTSISKGTVMSLTVTGRDGTAVTYTDCDQMTDFLAELKLSFKFSDLEEIDVTDESLSFYGIDESCRRISIFYNAPSDMHPNLLVDATFELLVGVGDGGNAYYTCGNSKNVYKADAQAIDELFEKLVSHAVSHESECRFSADE